MDNDIVAQRLTQRLRILHAHINIEEFRMRHSSFLEEHSTKLELHKYLQERLMQILSIDYAVVCERVSFRIMNMLTGQPFCSLRQAV